MMARNGSKYLNQVINMKKILILFVFLIAAIGLQAQTGTFDLGSGTMFTVGTDYTITGTTAIWFQFNAYKNYPLTQDFEVTLTKGTGTVTNVAVTLYGRKFAGDDWTQIGTALASGTITTTYTGTISNTLVNRYRQFKVLYQGTGTGTTTISTQIFKIWLQ